MPDPVPSLEDIPYSGYTVETIAERFNALLPLARAGRNIITYNDAAGVLADTSSGLAPGTRLLAADGTAFEVAPLDATDHHAANAGGVKLYEDGRTFTTRARLASWIARGGDPAAGQIYTAGGVRYLGQPGATTIADLPGLVFPRVFHDEYAHNYDLNGSGAAGVDLSVYQYFRAGSVTIPAGKQANVLRFSGDFSGGTKAKGIDFDLSFTDTTDGYSVIGLARNKGAGGAKSIYGSGKAEAGCTGVVVGVVAATEVDAGVSPSDAIGLQVSMRGTGTPTRSNGIMIGTDEASQSITHGVLGEDDLHYSDAFIKAFNGGAGAFLKWQEADGTIIFEVVKAGAIVHRNSAGAELFRTASTGGIDVGSTAAPEKSIGFSNATTRFALQAVTTGNFARIRDDTNARDLFRTVGGVNDAIQLWVGGALKGVTQGAVDSGGTGYRVLRVPNT
jgi:hypothetical protein